MVGGDFQEFRGVIKPVYLVQDDPLALKLIEERFGILQSAAGTGKLAIEVFNAGQALAEDRLAGPPDA